jgi:hypothetical protein
MTTTTSTTYASAFHFACEMLNENDGLEITSALKQAASDYGITEGSEMKQFVLWSYAKLGIA